MNEFELIKEIAARFEVSPPPRGPGDDCAVLPAQRASCVTTDALVENVHFTRASFSFADVGHKALAVNLSDLASMGAEPSWFTLALTLPKDVRDQQVLELATGMSALAKQHRIELIGGNVTAGKLLTVTITASGSLDARPLLRSGARAGDNVYVSGVLGDAAGGLLASRKNLRAPALLAAQRRPYPHVAFGRAVRHLASAAIDVSDGLLQDLSHLCTASGLGIALDSARLPMSEALLKTFPAEAEQLALSGGEDYVLVVTAPPRHAAQVEALGGLLIGGVTEAPELRLDGEVVRARGFQHRR